MTPALQSPALEPGLYWCLALFALALGSCIGSFLNVVVYRVPARISLLYPPSRCPKCESPIRFFDNVPLLGWLKLGGKCRDCHAPISMRYPLVEGLTALLFLGLALAEPLSGGKNLPATATSNAPLWGLYLYHIVLLCGLLVMALVEYDGQRLPRSWYIGLVAWSLLLGSIWSAFHPVRMHIDFSEFLGDWNWVGGAIDGLMGAMVASVMGCLASPATGEGPIGLPGRRTSMAALAAVGGCVGWQAAAGVSTVTAILYMLVIMFHHGFAWLRRVPFIGCLLVVIFCWIAGWSYWAQTFERLGPRGDHWTLIFCGGTVVLASWVSWLFRDPPPNC